MSVEEYEAIVGGVKPIISLPGLLPEVSSFIFSFVNPLSLALSKLNKEFKRYFYYNFNHILRQYFVRSWILIIPSLYKYEITGLLHIMKFNAEVEDMFTYKKERKDAMPYINFLETMFLKLPENFYSKLVVTYPESDETKKVFNLCGHLLSFTQLIHLKFFLKKEHTIFSKKLPKGHFKSHYTIWDLIFDKNHGIINTTFYRWPDVPSNFVKCIFIMHYDSRTRYIKIEDYPIRRTI